MMKSLDGFLCQWMRSVCAVFLGVVVLGMGPRGVLADEPCANCTEGAGEDVATVVRFAEQPVEGESDKTLLRGDIKALLPLANYVGTWRGIGQKRRGSAEGAWMETAECEYEFIEGRASLVFDAPEGKLFVFGRIEPTDDGDIFRYTGLLPDGKTEEVYTGKYQGGDSLLLDALNPKEGRPARIGIKIIARGDRMLTLFERKDMKSGRYLRISEIGATRKGSGYGGTGAVQNACIVTGGYSKGKMDYKGEGYYVCCGGCREMFKDDPEGVLAEWKRRTPE